MDESIKKILDIVSRQAEDEGLWFIAETAPEAYLQAALRDIHEILEKEFGGKDNGTYYKE